MHASTLLLRFSFIRNADRDTFTLDIANLVIHLPESQKSDQFVGFMYIASISNCSEFSNDFIFHPGPRDV